MFILMLVVALPILAARSARALGSASHPRPRRPSLHFNTLAMLCILLGLSVAVARKEGVVLFPAWRPGWIDAAALAGFLAVTLAALARRISRLDAAARERLELITMTDWRDVRQLAPYAAVCLMAGIAEEAAYRGVLTDLLWRETGTRVAAIVVASLAFGAAHAVQGWIGIVLAALFAALFHTVVLITGNLYAAMIGHATYDLIAGIMIARAAMRRAGAPVGARPSASPPDSLSPAKPAETGLPPATD